MTAAHHPLCESRRDTDSGPYLPCTCEVARVPPALAAIDRELLMLRERARAPRPRGLGCSTVSHDRLGYCYGCTPILRDGGPSGQALEVMGWRLLALRDIETAPAREPS